MKPPAIIILGETSIAIAKQIQASLPDALIYGLARRCQSADLYYDQFGETIAELFSQGHTLIGICAAGIMIRALAPLLSDKRAEPPVIAIAEDGSAVVPLLGGLNGANVMARKIATALQVQAAITTTGDLRFQTTLLSPPSGYRLLNDDQQAKTFLADLLAGASVRLVSNLPTDISWLSESNLPFADHASHCIEIINGDVDGTAIANRLSSQCLIYQVNQITSIPEVTPTGKLSIIGTGPGAAKWMSPEVKAILEDATDFVGYKTYVNLVKAYTKGKTVHASDNRVELDRARHALELATQGKSVVIVSSGDAGIYGMAAAVFEVLDHDRNPEWNQLDIHVAPGISAVQAAAAAIGAPIGHDFCLISLSDILKPWEVIIQRLDAAAQADFAIAIYNPISTQRKWQLLAAKETLLKWRSPETPVILGHRMGRKGENVQVITLAELKPELADMQTVIIVGSSKTKTLKICDRVRVYTPRKYE
ncbi:precorrin-3B C(17)-methyltransferase [Pseudanabaena mucicola]|uniref:Precorrin-3B C(17)-methyltransferase n=1 Tax=Pseudanabaena mucicola FACHB-723 TaxID=2692860 RepID=A0ABR7ZX73_9CYAN|nr:precorrin-3B C(17)-methyltransferase [Pseudanabaena mucicola]MBD2188374.1 precorrin-3B C(17)-methyltransferase [Pseudanabaena mucicola FACHB-723]